MPKRTNKYSGIVIISAIILFYLIPPFFFWNNFFSTIYVKTFFSFILAGIFFFNRVRWTGRETLLLMILSLSLVVYAISGSQNLNFIISNIPILLLPFAKEKFSKDVYNCFLNIYVVIISIGLIFWILAISGIVSPLYSIPPLNSQKDYNYNVYPFLVQAQGFSFARFHGPFDEPGVVGTFSCIFLCIEKFKLNSFKSIILLLSGLCSLSVFFYVLIAAYFLIYILFKKKNIFSLVLFLIIVSVVLYATQVNPVLYDAIGYRLEWDSSSGRFVGDNRINYDVVDIYMQQMKTSNAIWWGIEDKEAFLADIGDQSSFYAIIIVNGIIFTIIYFLFIIVYGFVYRSSKIEYLLYILVVLGVLYQRPWVFYPTYIFLFTYLARVDRIEKRISSSYK